MLLMKSSIETLRMHRPYHRSFPAVNNFSFVSLLPKGLNIIYNLIINMNSLPLSTCIFATVDMVNGEFLKWSTKVPCYSCCLMRWHNVINLQNLDVTWILLHNVYCPKEMELPFDNVLHQMSPIDGIWVSDFGTPTTWELL